MFEIPRGNAIGNFVAKKPVHALVETNAPVQSVSSYFIYDCKKIKAIFDQLDVKPTF